MSRITHLITLSSVIAAGCAPATQQARIDQPAPDEPAPIAERVTASDVAPPKAKPAAPKTPTKAIVTPRPVPALDDIHDRCRRTRAYPSWCREEKLRLRAIPTDLARDGAGGVADTRGGER
jgi:hypothetical protein